MADVAVQELEILDRDVARGWAALARWRRGLADDPAARAQEAPLEPVRHVAGKSTWEALGALVPSATDRDLREGLRRWVYALLQARLGLESEGAAASAATQKTARYEGEAPRLVSWREAWRGVVEAGTAADAERWLAAAADAGPALAAIQVRRAQTAVEAARRLGLGHPWEPLAPAPVAELVAAAMALLDETEDLARDTRRRYAPDARPASV